MILSSLIVEFKHNKDNCSTLFDTSDKIKDLETLIQYNDNEGMEKGTYNICYNKYIRVDEYMRLCLCLERTVVRKSVTATIC